MKQKNILILLVMTFVTVVVWIGSNIYHIIVTSTVDEELQEQIVPINPDFDNGTINKLKNRINAEPLYQYRQTVSPIPSPSQTGEEQSLPEQLPATDTIPVENESSGQEGTNITPIEQIEPQVTNEP